MESLCNMHHRSSRRWVGSVSCTEYKCINMHGNASLTNCTFSDTRTHYSLCLIWHFECSKGGCGNHRLLHTLVEGIPWGVSDLITCQNTLKNTKSWDKSKKTCLCGHCTYQTRCLARPESTRPPASCFLAFAKHLLRWCSMSARACLLVIILHVISDRLSTLKRSNTRVELYGTISLA